MPLRALDLFCGAGGFSLGLERSGYDVIAGVDTDEKALDTYRLNHDHGYYFDLQNPPENLLDLIDLSPSDVDVIVGGPPCQPYSPAGVNDPNDARRTLLLRYMDYVETLEPRAFIIENVKELATKYEDHLNAVLDQADDAEYVTDYKVLTASDYSIPQIRDRVFVVGILKDEGVEYNWPEPTTPDNSPPVWSILYSLDTDIPYPNQQKSNHDESVIEEWENSSYKDDPYSGGSNHQIRLHPDEPSWSIIKNSHWHSGKPRQLTPREEALIQSFPLWYRFSGGKTSESEQIGNAVPPVLVGHVARKLLHALDEPTVNPVDEIEMSTEQVADLGGRLTARESEVLLYLSEGWEWSDIADEMDVTVPTVHEYRSRAVEKYQEAQETISMYERLRRGV